MNRTFRRMAYVLTALALVVASGCDTKRPGLHTGDALPAVTLTDFYGNSVTLPQDIRGKIVLIRFWEIDCSHCNKDILFSLDSLYRKYKEQGFMPIGIHETRPVEADERFRTFAALSYPMLIDEYRTIATRFGVVGLPTTLIVDEQGIVREKIIGEADADTFEKLLTTVLYKGGIYDGAK